METKTDSKQAVIVISDYTFVKVLQNKATGQKSLHASTRFNRGDVISPFSAGSTKRHPTYLTVQIADKKHITLVPEFLQYINHSCAPNVFFDTTKMELVCLKAIKPGEELTFFYPSTEWDMAAPFACNCGSRECLQIISGAAQLSLDILEKYRLTDFIRQKINQQVTI